ncbi:ABC transporter ATP-binding protein [Chelatococcus daeguensis]|uniref:ABC transporter ATP-binding protein n=1 Tax=Chelatococcus daeguensis TaxID=444444 RepID=UPI0007AB36F3|nr:ABC transporter ATP-binding protein [Chelatococcus daeguensis]KZE28984.1 ABC transporter ATP-binding protein [Chelatococcus daeguensis]MBM3083677.1 ABC transporter ATP-binding protein [Chelatococcus daeguensis]
MATVLRTPQSFRERVGALRHLPAFIRLVWAASPALTSASIALRLARAVVPVLMLYVGKLIIDAVVAEARVPHPDWSLSDWIESGRLAHVGTLVALELCLAIVADVSGRLSSLVDSLLAETYSNFASIRLMEKAASLDLEQFESSEQQDRLDRARRQVTGRTSLLGLVFGQIQDILGAVTLMIALAAYWPSLILLMLIALLPSLLGELKFNALGYRLDYFRTPERRQLDYVRYLGSSIETAKEVKLFGLQRFLIERFRRFAETMYRDNRRLAIRRAFWGGLFAAFVTLAYYVAYAAVIWRTMAGDFSVGDMTFLVGSFLRLKGLLDGLLLGFSQVAGQALYLEDLFSFFEIAPRVVSPPDPVPVRQPIRFGFVFENVGFRYEGAQQWAIRHLDLEIPAGEVLALVGANGAGKTTLVKLLARLYDPTEGRILLDGRDLRDYDLDMLRSRVGVVFQDFVRFHFTASENIAIGDIGAAGDHERIAEAADRSLAGAIIARLPLGFEQPLGRRFGGGVDLSGGEWQKIAIARAYMRDAEVLILDEPTSALDAHAEYEVFQRFRDLSAGKTTLLISHRFSTVRMADRIIVLEGGRILEAGTHQVLVARGGRYAQMFELQAAGYR